LAEVALVLGQTRFDVVHFNNGLHGWGYSEDDYRKHFPQLVETIKKGTKDAKLIWASTTAVREAGNLDKLNLKTERVKERNRIALEFVSKEGMPVNDLFSLAENRPEFYSKDGVHFNGKGVSAQADQVSRSILAVLK
jgi:lysophospholipase L1-like esterase